MPEFAAPGASRRCASCLVRVHGAGLSLVSKGEMRALWLAYLTPLDVLIRSRRKPHLPHLPSSAFVGVI